MPVLLEHIYTPTPADWMDLNKIHQDTHNDGLTFDQIQLQQWLEQGGWIMAGRFNDRLLGVVLAKNNGDTVELSQAAVRKMTQRRGVMHQLLHFICAWSQQPPRSLLITHCPAKFNSALQKRGFQQQGNSWQYSHSNS